MNPAPPVRPAVWPAAVTSAQIQRVLDQADMPPGPPAGIVMADAQATAAAAKELVHEIAALVDSVNSLRDLVDQELTVLRDAVDGNTRATEALGVRVDEIVTEARGLVAKYGGGVRGIIAARARR